MGPIKGLISSLLLRKRASPEQRQIPSGGKGFLRGGKNIFQALGTSIHLTHPQLYIYRGKKQVVTGAPGSGRSYMKLSSP